jgi:hypothetical protein
MPETKKGKKILASINKGTIHGTGTQTERKKKSRHR